MKKSVHMRKLLAAALLCTVLCLCVYAFAFASGVEQDEEGGTWDYDKGIYTDPTGQQHQITPEGVDEGDSGSSVTQGDNDARVIDTGEADSLPDAKRNEDGSIEVQSGEGGVDIQDSPTRAPLEGDEWEALLAGVAARNGSETPTVWIDPATGHSMPAEVVYMGIGRSMVRLNGQPALVNTVDLKCAEERVCMASEKTQQRDYQPEIYAVPYGRCGAGAGHGKKLDVYRLRGKPGLCADRISGVFLQ